MYYGSRLHPFMNKTLEEHAMNARQMIGAILGCLTGIFAGNMLIALIDYASESLYRLP